VFSYTRTLYANIATVVRLPMVTMTLPFAGAEVRPVMHTILKHTIPFAFYYYYYYFARENNPKELEKTTGASALNLNPQHF